MAGKRKRKKKKRGRLVKKAGKRKPVSEKAVGIQVLTGVTPRWELEK